jgi:hypothetical protein
VAIGFGAIVLHCSITRTQRGRKRQPSGAKTLRVAYLQFDATGAMNT